MAAQQRELQPWAETAQLREWRHQCNVAVEHDMTKSNLSLDRKGVAWGMVAVVAALLLGALGSGGLRWFDAALAGPAAISAVAAGGAAKVINAMATPKRGRLDRRLLCVRSAHIARRRPYHRVAASA
jgi:hypothetical protein